MRWPAEHYDPDLVNDIRRAGATNCYWSSASMTGTANGAVEQ